MASAAIPDHGGGQAPTQPRAMVDDATAPSLPTTTIASPPFESSPPRLQHDSPNSTTAECDLPPVEAPASIKGSAAFGPPDVLPPPFEGPSSLAGNASSDEPSFPTQPDTPTRKKDREPSIYSSSSSSSSTSVSGSEDSTARSSTAVGGRRLVPEKSRRRATTTIRTAHSAHSTAAAAAAHEAAAATDATVGRGRGSGCGEAIRRASTPASSPTVIMSHQINNNSSSLGGGARRRRRRPLPPSATRGRAGSSMKINRTAGEQSGSDQDDDLDFRPAPAGDGVGGDVAATPSPAPAKAGDHRVGPAGKVPASPSSQQPISGQEEGGRQGNKRPMLPFGSPRPSPLRRRPEKSSLAEAASDVAKEGSGSDKRRRTTPSASPTINLRPLAVQSPSSALTQAAPSSPHTIGAGSGSVRSVPSTPRSLTSSLHSSSRRTRRGRAEALLDGKPPLPLPRASSLATPSPPEGDMGRRSADVPDTNTRPSIDSRRAKGKGKAPAPTTHSSRRRIDKRLAAAEGRRTPGGAGTAPFAIPVRETSRTWSGAHSKPAGSDAESSVVAAGSSGFVGDTATIAEEAEPSVLSEEGPEPGKDDDERIAAEPALQPVEAAIAAELEIVEEPGRRTRKTSGMARHRLSAVTADALERLARIRHPKGSPADLYQTSKNGSLVVPDNPAPSTMAPFSPWQTTEVPLRPSSPGYQPPSRIAHPYAAFAASGSPPISSRAGSPVPTLASSGGRMSWPSKILWQEDDEELAALERKVDTPSLAAIDRLSYAKTRKGSAPRLPKKQQEVEPPKERQEVEVPTKQQQLEPPPSPAMPDGLLAPPMVPLRPATPDAMSFAVPISPETTAPDDDDDELFPGFSKIPRRSRHLSTTKSASGTTATRSPRKRVLSTPTAKVARPLSFASVAMPKVSAQPAAPSVSRRRSSSAINPSLLERASRASLREGGKHQRRISLGAFSDATGADGDEWVSAEEFEDADEATEDKEANREDHFGREPGAESAAAAPPVPEGFRIHSLHLSHDAMPGTNGREHAEDAAFEDASDDDVAAPFTLLKTPEPPALPVAAGLPLSVTSASPLLANLPSQLASAFADFPAPKPERPLRAPPQLPPGARIATPPQHHDNFEIPAVQPGDKTPPVDGRLAPSLSRKLKAFRPQPSQSLTTVSDELLHSGLPEQRKLSFSGGRSSKSSGAYTSPTLSEDFPHEQNRRPSTDIRGATLRVRNILRFGGSPGAGNRRPSVNKEDGGIEHLPILAGETIRKTLKTPLLSDSLPADDDVDVEVLSATQGATVGLGFTEMPVWEGSERSVGTSADVVSLRSSESGDVHLASPNGTASPHPGLQPISTAPVTAGAGSRNVKNLAIDAKATSTAKAKPRFEPNLGFAAGTSPIGSNDLSGSVGSPKSSIASSASPMSARSFGSKLSAGLIGRHPWGRTPSNKAITPTSISSFSESVSAPSIKTAGSGSQGDHSSSSREAALFLPSPKVQSDREKALDFQIMLQKHQEAERERLTKVIESNRGKHAQQQGAV